MDLQPLILAARDGDLAAYGSLVEATQRMVFAVCFHILRRHDDALDATQDTYLRAFHRLADLHDPAAFPGWLRRIALTSAQDIARKRRFTFLHTADFPDLPILDDAETTWSDAQRHALARALLRLAPDDRRLCDRFYHGGWDIKRLAADAGATEPAMRKRLQRLRDHLRKDVEMNEQQQTPDLPLPADLPAQIVDLLARPRLLDFPENPVGKIADVLKARYSAFRFTDVPEVVALNDARALLGDQPHHLPPEYIHFLDAHRFLRYDLTLPLLLAARNAGSPLRLATAGQVYRNQKPTAMTDQSFHQFELLLLDTRESLDPWTFMGQTLHVLTDLLPNRNTQIEPVQFPDSSRAWELSVDVHGHWITIAAWGIFTDPVVRHLGADPQTHTAFGLDFGLERLAALHFGYNDIRTLATQRLPAATA